MRELVTPTARLHAPWLASRDEWGRGVHQPGAGLRPDDDVDPPEGFVLWVERLRRMADPTTPVPDGWVHATSWWIVEDGELVGAIQLRHALTPTLLEAGGHIGYGIRPSARRRGLATWALGEVVRRAGTLGLDRVLVTCDVDNVGSIRTIERNGGVLEDVRQGKRRYWIAVPRAGSTDEP
jgi:predicted acetyltransferase